MNNSLNSIDVDKLDYINRDCHHLGLKDMHFDHKILVSKARVTQDEVVYPSKYASKIYDLFNIRYRLYKQIYQHRVTQGVELMVT